MNYSTKRKTSDDIIVKEFWRNNERFAELFNAVLFNGKCIIKADELMEIDTDVSGTIKIHEYKETLKRTRDVVKKYYNGVEFNILGLEMQEKIHLAMPLRTMVYDALGYIKEYNDFANISNNYSEKSLSAELIDMISEMTGTSELTKIINHNKTDKTNY